MHSTSNWIYEALYAAKLKRILAILWRFYFALHVQICHMYLFSGQTTRPFRRRFGGGLAAFRRRFGGVLGDVLAGFMLRVSLISSGIDPKKSDVYPTFGTRSEKIRRHKMSDPTRPDPFGSGSIRVPVRVEYPIPHPSSKHRYTIYESFHLVDTTFKWHSCFWPSST